MVDQDNANRKPIDILYQATDEASIKVDIVAVHGLGSNVDWSWTWKSKSNPDLKVHWLRDPNMLPEKMPFSRIMTYNYESKWHVNAPKTRLRICGEELVRSVYNSRDGAHDRPIIFIGHSLGGLVIQHALLFTQISSDYKALLDHTAGFIALGTPFRGSEMQGLANIAATLLAPMGSHTGILQDLNYDNPNLADKVHDLCRLRDKMSFSISCFFELYEIDYGKWLWVLGWFGFFRGMVVSEASACIDGCPRISLQADHLMMNKYSRPDDRSFLAVSEEIYRMYSNWRIPQTRQKNSETGASPQGHFIVPFGRNESFVGREDILQKLKQRIPPLAYKDSCQRTALIGLGGVGKTQIALEAAHQVREQHPHCSIFWVPAIDMTSFENGYREIGQALKVKGLDEKDANVKALVKAALSQESVGEWLLIVDNVDDPDIARQVSAHLPLSRKGSILVTTRNQKLNTQAPKEGRVNITHMDRNESIQLLKHGLDDDQITDSESLNTLARFLEDLPLAIKQASAYMVETQMTTARYLEHCQSSDDTMIELLTKDFEDESRYETLQNPIATTWLISFHHIMRHAPLAVEYLRFICFLAEKNIPISLLPPGDSELQREEAIGTLQSYSCITKQRDATTFDIHRLVRLAMRNWMQSEQKWETGIKSVIHRLVQVLPFADYGDRDVWMGALPHVISALKGIPDECIQEDELILLRRKARFYHLMGKYGDAEEIYERIVPLSMKVRGVEHPTTLNVENSYALTLKEQGKYTEAEQIFRRILGIQMTALGRENPHTLVTMNNLAIMLCSQSRFQEAEQLHSQVLELRTRIQGQEHRKTLSSKNNVGTALIGQGKFREAEQLYRQLLPLQQKVIGNDHPNTLCSMNSFGATLLGQGKAQEAEEVLGQLLPLAIKVYGREHPKTLGFEESFGRALLSQGRNKDSEQLFRQLLLLKQRLLGRDNHETLDTMNSLGMALINQGQNEEAEQILSKALALRRMVVSEAHTSTLLTMINLGASIGNQARHQEAEELYREALSLSVKELGTRHSRTLMIRKDLEKCLRFQERTQGADPMQREIETLEEPSD
ncbi:Kinesin light chain-like protein [Cladobotryum mycophilum]|uniref:Kinesin light chain-like protein n=1 Tax=Cladobotryum mycophilum TaxID=491253 RepID=A0ABR0S958_9HYPO